MWRFFFILWRIVCCFLLPTRPSTPSSVDVNHRQGKALERPEDHTPKMWMVHKTRNELVTRHDPEGRATVFARLAKLKMPDTLMPVVRAQY